MDFKDRFLVRDESSHNFFKPIVRFYLAKSGVEYGFY